MAISGVTSSNNWYQVDQAWNRSRQAISQQFLDASSLMNSALSDAMTNQISGMATLAGQAALSRIQGATATASGATSSTSASSSATSAGSSTGTSGSSGPQYAKTSAASILSNANIVNFFA
jgi:hypothetical protein